MIETSRSNIVYLHEDKRFVVTGCVEAAIYKMIYVRNHDVQNWQTELCLFVRQILSTGQTKRYIVYRWSLISLISQFCLFGWVS